MEVGMKTVSTKLLPEALKSLTRKKNFWTKVQDGPFAIQLWSYWDGGSKSEYCGWDGARKVPLNLFVANKPPQFGGKAVNAQFGDDLGLVSYGTSCGKPATVCLRVTLGMAIKMAGFKDSYDFRPDAPPAWVRDWLKERDYEAGCRFEQLFVED
jgi:hypothetical protein